MAALYKMEALRDGLEGFLEDRATGLIREARILAHGEKGWCIEIVKPDVRAWPTMVVRMYSFYNKVIVEGWRFWDSKPDSNDREPWSIL